MRSGGQRQFTLNAATPTSDNSHFAEATKPTSLEIFEIFLQKFCGILNCDEKDREPCIFYYYEIL